MTRMREIMQKMRRNRKHHNSLDSRGMSLVEVIIAIMILSVVVVPTLHVITQAMTYNAKARLRQSVTVSAESIMEVFKGYDMESLLKAFDADAVDGIVTEGGSFEYTPDTPGETKMHPTTFKITNVKTETASNIKLINVEVTATPTVKENDIIEIANFNKEYDAIFRGNKDLDKDAYDKAIDDFKKNHLADFLIKLNDKDERKRKLDGSDVDYAYLKLKEKKTEYTVSGSGSEMHAYVSVKYVYGMTDYPYYTRKVPVAPAPGESETEHSGEEESAELSSDEIDEEDFLDDFEIKEENKLNFPDTDVELLIPVDEYISRCSLVDDATKTYEFAKVAVSPDPTKVKNRLFIYYFPKYNKEITYTDALGTPRYVDNSIKDTIKINSDMPIDCYLIKQKPYVTDMPDLNLITSEDRYSSFAKVSGDSNITLYHNMATNIGNGSSAGNPIETASFGKVYDYVTGAGTDDAGKKNLRKDKIVVYKLEMKIFEVKNDGSQGNMIAQFDGTMGEKKLNND